MKFWFYSIASKIGILLNGLFGPSNDPFFLFFLLFLNTFTGYIWWIAKKWRRYFW